MSVPTTTIGGGHGRRHQVSRIALGAMNFGTRTDEATSFALLDRYVDAGGRFVDTSNNYAFWNTGSQGGESESVLGRWLAASGMSDEVIISTKLGGRPEAPARSFTEVPLEQQTPERIRAAVQESLERLGRDRIELYYSHIPDDRVPLADQVAGFGAVVTDGLVDVLGASNHWMWSVEQARRLAAEQGVAGYQVLQYAHTYLTSRTDRASPFVAVGDSSPADGSVRSYVEQDSDLRLVAYSPLIGGAYANPDRSPGSRFDHAGNPARRAALVTVAQETGATPNQVVLAWLLASSSAVIPLVGASSVAQLDDTLGALEVELTDDQVARLSAAGLD